MAETRASPVRGRVVMVAALAMVAAGLVAASGPASGSHLVVTAVKGSAFGYHSFSVVLFGGAQEDEGPAPAVALASDASNSPQSATLEPASVYFGPATILTSARITVSAAGSVGPSGGVTTSTDIQDVNRSRVEIFGEDNYDCCIPHGQNRAGEQYSRTAEPYSLEPRPATDVASSCTASESGVTATTTLANGWLYLDNGYYDGDDVYPEPAAETDAEVDEHDPVKVLVPTNPAVGQAYEGHIHLNAVTDRYVVMFNEQITNPDGSLTVNAVHYYFGHTLDDNGGPVVDPPSGLKGELILGQSVCGVATVEAPTTTTTEPPTTTTTTPPNPGTVACGQLATSQARLNAQLDAVANVLRAVLSGPAEERAVARIEELRARLNAQLTTLQDRLGCLRGPAVAPGRP